MSDARARSGAEAARILAAIVESSDDAIVAKDLNGTILSWNRGAERMYGYSAGEVVGRPIYLIVPPPFVDELSEILERPIPVVRIGQVIVKQDDVERSVTARQGPQGRFAIARLADATSSR